MDLYFVFYSIVSFIVLAVHLAVNWPQLAGWNNAHARVGAFHFSVFLVCLMLFFVSDLLWGVFSGLRCPRLLYADTVFYFLAMAASVCSWVRYAVVYLDMKGWQREAVMWSGRGILAYFAVGLVVNAFAGGFFRIGERAVFVAGPLRYVAFGLMIAFNAFVFALAIARLRTSSGAYRRRSKVICAFALLMTLAILLQITNPLLPFFAFGCLLGCCTLHVFVFEDERDEMHRNELLARDYKAQLEAERNANMAKSLFFSSISHDIRTPLNAIIGFSELLEKGVGDAGERERYLSSIRASGKVLARLVDDVLDLSKMESGKLEIIDEPTNIPALAYEVIAACEVARARKSLALKSEIASMPWVNVDPQRIRQLLYNLLSNAYKYTDRGTITVRALWKDDGTLTLSVADTGKGISPENLTRILQPFVQVADKNHRDGTGLGLAICNKLAKLMDGELTVESKVGVGSTFTITLHNVKTAEKPAAESQAKSGARSIHSPSRVLVVDDSPVNRAVLKAMLSKCGVSVIATAENGRDALDQLAKNPDFDLVLSDMWMPVMDGCELVHAIRADPKLSHLPVYLVTADVEARKQAGSDGFTGMFLKPITLDRLLELFT